MPQSTVFISYSQNDEAEKDALIRQLGGLQRQGLFKVWSADQIGPGVEKQPVIQQAIVQAKVAILLITADYLDSDEINKMEIPTLLARQRKDGLVIYPVIAKYCSWETVSWLKPLQVRPPSNRGPVWREGGRYADEGEMTLRNPKALKLLTISLELKQHPRHHPVKRKKLQ